MRNDGDRWSITESVGVTALGVAAARAVETQRPDGLVRDPYAEEFVLAAGGPAVQMLPSRRSVDAAGAARATYIGVRSRFFDRFCAEAAATGITQTVILAAGLDTRALRLTWPEGSTVFEIDQPGVLEFKDQVLADRRPSGAADRVVVPMDLREDWPVVLRAAGFDPGRPSAWLAEGLLGYLPPQAEADLFERVTALSITGGRIAVEYVTATRAEVAEHTRDLSTVLGINFVELGYWGDDREDPAQRLRRYGWSVTETKAADFAEAHERLLNDDFRQQRTTFVEAARG